jgi:hypothetical protein
MLIKLSPEKLSDHWPLVYRAIKSSSIALAEMSEDRINNVLRSLMAGHATCWVHEREGSVTTVVITTITEEPVSKTFNLLIYCAHMFMKCKSDDYVEMIKNLRDYAVSLNCSRIVLYCSNNKLTDVLTRHGATSIYSLIVFPCD